MNKTDMNKTDMNKMDLKLTEKQLAHLGGGVLGYVREIENGRAMALLGGQSKFPPNARLYCLYNADGSPISISGSREAAVGDAISHDLIPATVH
jgi:hypothetical protein